MRAAVQRPPHQRGGEGHVATSRCPAHLGCACAAPAARLMVVSHLTRPSIDSGVVARPLQAAPCAALPEGRDSAQRLTSTSSNSYDCEDGSQLQLLDPSLKRYRQGVGICVINRRGEVFAAQRCDDVESTWQMPQGGIDDGEPPELTAKRELWEETGIPEHAVEVIAAPARWYSYHYPTQVKCKVNVGHYQQYDGQVQRWFLMRFNGDDSLINIDRGAHTEFRAWRWMPLEALPQAVVDFKRGVYEAVVAEFLPIAQRLRASGGNGANGNGNGRH